MKKLLLLGSLIGAFFISGIASAADCARVTGPYSDGDVLYANDYENEQNTQIACINSRTQDTGDTMTGTLIQNGGDIKVYSGGDLLGYSDTGSTVKFKVDSATGATVAGLTQPGQTANCGISVSGSTLTISGYDATSLSASNPCVVAINGNTSGQTELVYFTSNVTVTFGAASNTDGNLFGLSAADWSNAMPFFIGVITDGTNKYFTIGRKPFYISDSASTGLCQKDDTDCDAELDVMILTTGLTLSSWVSKNITQVGWFRATYTSATTAWTFSASSSLTGFNFGYEGLGFNFPTGQMGADSGSNLDAGSDTVPTWATAGSIRYRYTIDRSGEVSIQYSTKAAGNATNGTGGTQVKLMLPYDPAGMPSSFALYYPCGVYGATGATAAADGTMNCEISNGNSYVSLQDYLTNPILSNDFSSTGDDLTLFFNYKSL